MSIETLNNIRKKRKKLDSNLRSERKIGRICKFHGEYYHTQTLLHKDERQRLLDITGKSVQESLRMAVIFYLENKKDD
jgi:hypothetical protein